MKLGIVLLGVIIGVGVMVAWQADAEPWTETFDGNPSAPTAWASSDWDIQYHNRDSSYWVAPEGMAQQHGGDCSAPPMTHPASSWPGAVYQCNNHVMTAINASGYGALYLTPNRMADWSSGPAVINFDLSTERRSSRDWPDVWITPFGDNLATPLIDWLPDLQGKPRNTLHLDFFGNEGKPTFHKMVNGSHADVTGWVDKTMHSDIAAGTNTAATRQPFRLTITSTSAKFERLASATGSYILYWDVNFANVGFTSGVVTFGHHSYTPWKDGEGGPQTWHWDNISINPSIPFTMIKADRRYVTNNTQVVTFAQPAPANAFLRFSSTHTPSISIDGGPWVLAQKQWEQRNVAENASTYWHPIPQGAQSVRVQHAARSWYTLNWPAIAKDFGIWSLEGGAPSTPTTAPTATSTSTPSPTSLPTNTATVTATDTPVPTSTPEPTNTPVPTATNTPISPTATPTWQCEVRVRERLGNGSWVQKWVPADPAVCGR